MIFFFQLSIIFRCQHMVHKVFYISTMSVKEFHYMVSSSFLHFPRCRFKMNLYKILWALEIQAVAIWVFIRQWVLKHVRLNCPLFLKEQHIRHASLCLNFSKCLIKCSLLNIWLRCKPWKAHASLAKVLGSLPSTHMLVPSSLVPGDFIWPPGFYRFLHSYRAYQLTQAHTHKYKTKTCL